MSVKSNWDFLLRRIGEKGQTMIEYALVAVLIAIVLVFVFRSPGVNQGLSKAGSRINSTLTNAR